MIINHIRVGLWYVLFHIRRSYSRKTRHFVLTDDDCEGSRSDKEIFPE